MDGPAAVKLPFPVPLLRGICVILEALDCLDADALDWAITHGFWFLMRSVEYLAEDGCEFDSDRSVTWWRQVSGKLLSWKEAWSMMGILFIKPRRVKVNRHKVCSKRPG